MENLINTFFSSICAALLFKLFIAVIVMCKITYIVFSPHQKQVSLHYSITQHEAHVTAQCY